MKSSASKAAGTMPAAKGFPSGAPMGGVHVHSLERENRKTMIDGAHAHAFLMPDGSVIATEEGGLHGHTLYDEAENFATDWDGEHFHRITMADGTSIDTEFAGSGHSHDVQDDSTAIDGTHNHRLKLPTGAVIESLQGGDAWAASGRPTQAGSAPAPAMSELAQVQSFKLVDGVVSMSGGNLHVSGVPDSLAKSIESAIGEMLSPDVGQKLRSSSDEPGCEVVEIADLVIKVRPEFVAKTGKRTRIVQVAGILPPVLAWSAVKKGFMPPDGESCLPASLASVIPEVFRYWTLKGDKARTVRDALFDSGLVTEAKLRKVAGETRLIETKMFLVEPGDISAESAIDPSFEGEVSRMVARKCIMWSVDDEFPDSIELGEKNADAVLVFDPKVTKKWIDDEGIQKIANRVASLDYSFVFACPDSIGARSALSKVGTPFTARRSALAGMLFVSNADPSQMDTQIVTSASFSFDREAPFTLSKQEWQSHSLWHLMIGDERWALQSDPSSGDSVSMLRSGADILEGSIEQIDKGRAVTVKDDGDTRLMRFNGAHLSGERRISRVGGSSVWKLDPEAAREVAKSYDVSEFVIKAEDERFVFGIVLEPDGIDAQDDTISEFEVRSAAHKFLAEFQNIGVMHTTLTKEVLILESFLAPVDFVSDGQEIKKGTWLLAVKVLSDKIWDAIKDGTFTGFSIGGSAIRQPA